MLQLTTNLNYYRQELLMKANKLKTCMLQILVLNEFALIYYLKKNSSQALNK